MRPRVFVDANVWYPPSVRSVALGVGLAGLAEIVTSEGVLDELHRHLAVTAKTNLSPAHAQARVEELRRTLLGARADSVCAIDAGSSLSPVGLPDPDDEHVVAGALAADADLLITQNVGDFPPSILEKAGLDVLSADEYFHDLLNEMHPMVIDVVRLALTFPPRGVQDPQALGTALYDAGLQATGGVLCRACWQGAI